MSEIIDDRTEETKARHKLRKTWETANPVAKQGLPAPSSREEFDSDEEFEEARGWWISHVGRVLAFRELILDR